MNLAQSPHVPAAGKKPGLADMGWLTRYAGRGLIELVRARLSFAKLQARDIPIRNRSSVERTVPPVSPSPETLARIAYVLPRLSDRLPWRSDCLIQAIAAQNWLQSLGAPSEIRIGVENPKDGNFGAHAWLVHEGHVVTGGDISRYRLLLADHPANESDQPVIDRELIDSPGDGKGDPAS